MRIKILAFAASLLLISNSSLGRPQTPALATSSTQAATLLAQSSKALTGSAVVNDVTLTGTAERIAGSDDETGAAVLKALASGVGRLDLNFASGSRTEMADLSNAPTGAWRGPDRIIHAVPFHNLLNESAWFFPGFAIGRRISAPGYAATYIGHETRQEQAVEHVAISQVPPSVWPAGAVLFQHLTQLDFYLDSTTSLPAAVTFVVHPDDNELVDIPVEIRFSDYRSASGNQVPFHVQKFVNNTLVLDIQIQNVSFNTGLSATDFAIQ
jgi:hypothetical protein